MARTELMSGWVLRNFGVPTRTAFSYHDTNPTGEFQERRRTVVNDESSAGVRKGGGVVDVESGGEREGKGT